MKRFKAVIGQLLASYLAASLMYRFDFVQSVVASLLWSGLSFASAILVTSQTPSVLGMNRSDMLLLAATYGIVVGLYHWLCNRGFAGFSEVIHRGELDGFLLKPFDTVTLLSLRNIGWSSAIRFGASIFLTGWLLNYYQIPVGPAQVLSFVILTGVSFFLIYSLYTISVTVLIWHPYLSNVVDLVGNSVGTSRYPLDIRRYTPKWISLYFLPFLLIVNIPTRALTGRLSWQEAGLFVLFVAGLFWFSRWFWRRALWAYTGASG